MSQIILRGARQNNLRGIDLELPHGSLTVVTGVSGSGKSSLALDTLFAEGQRRFVESLSTYSRQFLRRFPRPDVDRLEGIPPAIAIERKSPAASSRSTVGTAAEIHDFLRLLFARVGRACCLVCGGPVTCHTVTDVVERASAVTGGMPWMVLFPVEIPPGSRGCQKLADLLARGYERILLRGDVVRIEAISGEEDARRDGWVVVDRLRIDPGGEETRRRLSDSLETAFREGEGVAGLLAASADGPLGDPQRFRLYASCETCGARAPDPRPDLFSFNSPHGACPRCRGFGDLVDFDAGRVVPDADRSLEEGALDPWRRRSYRYYHRQLLAFCVREGIPTDVPYRTLRPTWKKMILEGHGAFRGALPFLTRLYRKRYRAHIRFFLRRYMSYVRCPECDGTRLRPEARSFRVGGRGLGEITRMSIREARSFFRALCLSGSEEEIVARVLAEIRFRLDVLGRLGLDYLTLDRLSRTLSGGEAQRIGLAAALGSGLTHTLYVLDEPTIGLHSRDAARLLGVLGQLRDLGNTLVVVEHDRQVIEAGDHVVELGPGAGQAGGHLVFAGPAKEFRKADTLTSRYLRGELRVADGRRRRRSPQGWLTIRGAREHNLKNIDVAIPLGVLVGVTGVSGSGKSTLTREILYRALGGAGEGAPGSLGCDGLEGQAQAGDVVLMDQSPIGSSPRSVPVTYVGAFAPIREAFAATREARLRGLRPGYFSFNVAGGRCEECRGEGLLRVEMQFLADLFVPCDGCHGTRYQNEALEITLGGKSIHEVLALTVDEARHHFRAYPAVRGRLESMAQVGLGYLTLGQPAPTLSAGEAQRLKIARELDLRRTRPAFYLLDEPTTGLHFHDVRVLLRVLGELVERGNTVLVVEHHPDVIAACDYLIDLGPEGGDEGGEIVAAGTPEEVARSPRSHTGRILRQMRRSGARALPSARTRSAEIREREPASTP